MKAIKGILADFRRDFEASMTALEEEYGLVIDMKSISYSENDFDFKVKAISAGNREDADQIEFAKYCGLFGYQPHDFKRLVYFRGEEYLLYGFKPRSPKNNVIILDPRNGKKYVTNENNLNTRQK